MKEPAPYTLKTVMKMVVVVFTFTLIFDSVGLFKWAYRLPVESPLRSMFVEIFEPVYVVTNQAGLLSPVTFIREGYKKFAEIDEGAGFDLDPASLVRHDRYSWLGVEKESTELLEAKVVPFETSTGAGSTDSQNTGVLQILLIGDSMMKVGFEDILKKALNSLGNVEITTFSKNSTGLTRQDYFDWFKQLEKLTTGKKYNLIVLMIGTNDAQGVNHNGKDIYYGTKEWSDLYRTKVNKFAQTMSVTSEKFYWMGMPPMRDPKFDAKMKAVSKIYEEETSKFNNGKFISTIPVLGDARGGYTAYNNIGGKQVLTRGNDGIHFTNGGGQLLTNAVLDKFKSDFKR
ncbi:MAG: DUF459 domain-containing protein [Ignavibacteriaceae bacterium]|nr:DUF459 domain-containing protein [Ignavibacteriaceae bacterium]